MVQVIGLRFKFSQFPYYPPFHCSAPQSYVTMYQHKASAIPSRLCQTNACQCIFSQKVYITVYDDSDHYMNNIKFKLSRDIRSRLDSPTTLYNVVPIKEHNINNHIIRKSVVHA